MIQLLFGAQLVNVTDVSQWTLKDGSLQWSKSMNQSWSCQFTLRDTDGLMLQQIGRPKVGQPFWITETINNVRTIRFSGLITSVLEQAYPSTVALQWECQSKGWSAVSDHRVLTADYVAGDPALNVIQDIVNSTIGQDGITLADVDGFVLLAKPITFNPSTVTDAFNQLKTLIGECWWIDENKGLHFKAIGAGGNSGLTVADATGNWLNGSMQVTSTSDNYRNVEYEMTAQPVGTVNRTDQFTGDGHTFFFVTRFPLQAAPTVTINGSSQPVFQEGADPLGQNGWYWILNGYGIMQGQDIPPANGATIVVTYDAISISYTVDQNAGEVTARAAIEGTSGKWEHIDNTATIQTADVAHAYGQGQLKNYAVIPQTLKFDTYDSRFDSSLGKYVTFALTLHDLFGHWTITDVSAAEDPDMASPVPIGDGGTMKYTVSLTNEMQIGDFIQWFLGFTNAVKNATAIASAAAAQIAAQQAQTPPPRSEVHGWYLGAGSDLVLTATFADIPGAGGINFQNSGNLVNLSIQGDNILGQHLEVMVYKNGTAITKSGSSDAPLVLTDGSTTVEISTQLNPSPLPVVGASNPPLSPLVTADIFTIKARYVESPGSPLTIANAQDVYIQLMVQY